MRAFEGDDSAVWAAYFDVLARGTPLIVSDDRTGRREWNAAIVLAMLERLHLEPTPDNVARLRRWLVATAANSDVC